MNVDEWSSDTEDENELRDLIQLNAILEADEHVHGSASTTSSHPSSKSLISTSSTDQECSRIDHALALNKLYEEKLRRLETVLIDRLRECREKLNAIQGQELLSDKQETFRYVHCGKPYFKDKSNFPAPDNEDTIFMAKNNMYDFSAMSLVPGWTMNDKTQFMSVLLKLSQEKKKKELHSTIAEMKRCKGKKGSKQLDKEISAIQRQIENVNKMTLTDLALPLDQEYDWDLIATKLSQRHTAAEFKALWKLFLHPSINKSSWTKHEHVALQKIANQHNCQDWDTIAKKHNTGRTGYQCFVYFRTNVSNSFTGQKWTKEEEEYLKRLIEYYREVNYIPWNKVAATMENRTKIQIYNKYLSLCSNRKGKFVREEDAVILTCVEEFGTNFRKMTKYLPGRSVIQIRCRYNILRAKRLSAVWTLEEDQHLVQLVANMDDINFASIAKYFPGKDRAHLRARYLTLEKWMKRNPCKDIAAAPRRGARRLGHGKAADNLNKAIEKLKKKIQKEVQIKKKTKITVNSSEDIIEDAIIATLTTEHIKEEESRRIQLNEERLSSSNNQVHIEATNTANLRRLLVLLRTKLNKQQFEASANFSKFPGLTDNEENICIVKVKSYSKSQDTKIIKMTETPDIWGNNRLKNSEYVLPPSYTTITGLKKIMAFVSSNSKKPSVSPLNFNLLSKKNVALKEQMHILFERFHTLFMWPMLLSNEGPSDACFNKFRPGPSRQICVNPISPDIDLEESYEKKEI